MTTGFLTSRPTAGRLAEASQVTGGAGLPVARIPRATYRLQLNRQFTFRDARRAAAYLHQLGVSDLYASPYLKASAESTHGYDVADHNALNPAIGSEAEYEALVAELRRLGLGQLLDIVPNHMGITERANRWWMDVLENGPGSPYAHYFDITWESPKPELRNKVLLPILGSQYGVVLENGELVLAYQDGALVLCYYEHSLPIAPGTFGHVLRPCLGALAAELEPSDEHLLELQAIISAVERLPRPAESEPTRLAERLEEVTAVKARVSALVDGSARVRQALDSTLRMLNGVPGQPTSFDRLDALLEAQAYRLAYWRVASEEINYRRFFDVNQLAAIRVEEPAVFQETHRLILRLLREGKLTGLRIDHPDGLWDPAAYLRQLQRAYLAELGIPGGGPDGADESADPLAGSDRAGLPLYVVVEKILARGEELPESWLTHGTTGYDFAAAVGGLLVDQANRRAFDELYARFVGQRIEYRDLINSTKKMIMLVSLASEVNALSHRLNSISERHRRFRDFTPQSLTFAIREVIAALPVYRTYSTCEEPVDRRDREAIQAAVVEAKRRNPRTETSIFDFIGSLLLLEYPVGSNADDRADQCEFVMKFQQTTGPVMAKGVEDTAFYVYNRLVALNEVGGEPTHFGLTPAELHRHNATRQQRWPHSLLATTTHDTKRSEDVRARISVLSELPKEFRIALSKWGRLNARHKRRVDGQSAPDRNDEYQLYQTLLGTWPLEPLEPAGHQEFVERIQTYLLKAAREAKVHTSWVNQNQEYEQALHDFIDAILDERRSVNFLASFRPLQGKVAHYGVFNSLTQTLLKLTCPGVPDLYQGSELWSLSLVDPDNRRPVDFGLRARLLRQLKQRLARAGARRGALLRELLERPDDGRVKLLTTHLALAFRGEHPELFRDGSYEPLQTSGTYASNLFAFSRAWQDQRIVVATPRLLTQLVPYPELPLGDVWRDTRLLLPAALSGRYRDLFSQETLVTLDRGDDAVLAGADLFARFPLACLERIGD